MTDAVIVVQTPRLVVREKTLDDALDDFRWRRDPEVARYDGAEPLEMAYSEFLRQFHADLVTLNPAREAFAIDTADGRHIGNLMYYNADPLRYTAEIGVSIGELDYRGHGIGSEAVAAFVYYLWVGEHFRRLVLHTLEWNERARRSFERAGFAAANTIRRGGQVYLRMEARRDTWLTQFGSGGIPALPDANTLTTGWPAT